MKVKVLPNSISGVIKIPPSKSYAHRILICACLSSEECVVQNLVLNNDIVATMNVLKEIGAKIVNIGENEYKITPIDKKLVYGKTVNLFADESGSTLRFIIPIVSALGLNAVVDGKAGLRARPIKLLLDVLRSHGAVIEGDSLPIKMSGKIGPGTIEVDSTQSSQNITGLLFALTLLDGESRLVTIGEKVSKGYLDVTLSVMNAFGVKISENSNGYLVSGQSYVAPEKISVEGDYSSAGFITVLGVLCGKTVIQGLNENSKQGDRKIIEVLQSMGGKVHWEKGELVSEKSELKGVFVDGTDIPDLLPIISVCCAFCDGVSKIKGVDRLKIKESDRLLAVRELLDKFGVKNEYEDNTLIITGSSGKLTLDSELDGFNDHRMVMSAVVMAIRANAKAVVTTAQAVDKSYPAFFEDLKKMGGEKIVELL